MSEPLRRRASIDIKRLIATIDDLEARLEHALERVRALEAGKAQTDLLRMLPLPSTVIDVLERCADLISTACPDATAWTDGLADDLDRCLAPEPSDTGCISSPPTKNGAGE